MDRSGKVTDYGVIETIGQLVERSGGSDLIFVDIPIGLPDGGEGRACDREARRNLGMRGGSVFPALARAVIDAESYDEAKRISREAAGKAVSKQTFAILSKIREVDRLLRGCEKARRIVREIHPEVCFWALNRMKPMAAQKKSRLGFCERLALLNNIYPSARTKVEEMSHRFPRKDVSWDDMLDAMVAAITASADFRELRTLPEQPERDRRGLPMEMVYAPADAVRAVRGGV